MLKNSTDVYFIQITSIAQTVYMVNNCPVPLLDHIYELKCYSIFGCFWSNAIKIENRL